MLTPLILLLCAFVVAAGLQTLVRFLVAWRHSR